MSLMDFFAWTVAWFFCGLVSGLWLYNPFKRLIHRIIGIERKP